MAKRTWNFLPTQANQSSGTTMMSDKDLPANCFTLARFGEPREGIELSLDPGADEFRPLQPRILVGGWYTARDRVDGCLYEEKPDGRAFVRRALVNTIVAPGKRPFHTLKRPVQASVGGTSLLKIELARPNTKRVTVGGRELRLYVGVEGGTIHERDGYEVLLTVKEGEKLFIFYEDGGVRTLQRQGVRLVEKLLTSTEMLEKRIENAHARLEVLKQDPRPEAEQMMYGLMASMSDLFYITQLFRDGQGMRRTLIREFFLRLSPDLFYRIRPKLEYVLKEVDSVLTTMLYSGTFSSEASKVVSINSAPSKQQDLAPEERARRREENIRRDEEQRAAKESRQKQFREGRRQKSALKTDGKKGKPDGKKKHQKDDRKRA